MRHFSRELLHGGKMIISKLCTKKHLNVTRLVNLNQMRSSDIFNQIRKISVSPLKVYVPNTLVKMKSRD